MGSKFLGIFLTIILVLFQIGIVYSETPKSSDSSTITLENALAKLKLKARTALGYQKSGQDGSNGSGSFEVPDTKLQFNFVPDEQNTLTLRFNLNNGAANTPLVDYLFIQSKDFVSFLKDTPFSLSGRLGRMKVGVGEETLSNNPIESALPSNSAANVDVLDEGIELSGKFWAVSAWNGSRGTGSDSGEAKAWAGKLYYSPLSPLYFSATYYDSGSLKASQSEISVGGLVDRPIGTTNWKRRIWEVDMRYDFGKGTKPLNPPSHSDSKAIVRLSYGQFDDRKGASERNGSFGFIDILHNCFQKVYLGGRASFINLDGSQTAILNNVTTNRYERYSIGMGYRWFENTHVRLGYDFNHNSGRGINDANDNLFSALLAIQL